MEELSLGGLWLISGGIENYFVLVDVMLFGIVGVDVESVLEKCGIMVNKNMILFDEWKLFDFSGIWIGILVIMICGMGKSEF